MKKLVVLIFVLFVLSGCTKYTLEQSKYFIPDNAILLKEHGQGWVEFELEGKVYLYRGTWLYGYHRSECITLIGILDKTEEVEDYKDDNIYKISDFRNGKLTEPYKN